MAFERLFEIDLKSCAAPSYNTTSGLSSIHQYSPAFIIPFLGYNEHLILGHQFILAIHSDGVLFAWHYVGNRRIFARFSVQ